MEMVSSNPLVPDKYRGSQAVPSNRGNKRQYCGSDFPSRLNDVCAVFPSYFPSSKITTTTGQHPHHNTLHNTKCFDFIPTDLDAAINTNNDQISGISASYCCEIGCTPKELESFCEGIHHFVMKKIN